MTVFVDDFYKYNKKSFKGTTNWSHLSADTPQELHDFAKKLNLKRIYYQYKSFPHYDITLPKRKLAIKYGAIPLSIKDFIKKQKQNIVNFKTPPE